MSGFHIVVCGSIVPDPLQTLEPVAGPAGPALKNEMMLPAVLDPWAGHALFEAANLAKAGGGKVWLVSLGPKAKLQQVMMSIGQKVPFELVVLDGPAGGFTDASEVAEALAGAIESIEGLDRERLLVFGGWQSASRGTGAVMQMVGERLGIVDQFQGVDELDVLDGGAFRVKERVEGGSYQISECAGAPAVLGWATGNLPEPPNNPQVGMANMRLIMPALQKAKPAPVGAKGVDFKSVNLPGGRRETRIVKDMPLDDMAHEIADWIKQQRRSPNYKARIRIMEKILFLGHPEGDGLLSRGALETLTCAMELAKGVSGELAVGLFGADVQAAADGIAGCGAPIFGVSGDDFASARYATDAAAIQALCENFGATMVVAPTTSRLSRVLPGVAQRLGGRVDTQLSGLGAEGGEITAKRWYYRQRMEGTLTREQRPWFVTVSPGSFEAFEGAGSANVTAVAAEVPDSLKRSTVTGIESPAEDEQTIRPDADMLFVAGAGWTKKQADGGVHMDKAEQLILGMLDSAKASLGSSKSLVDLSGEGQSVLTFMTHLHQVGQTGATPRHPKGLATCCHGEEPHVVGWRFIKERRAVNLDAGCGWAQGKADVLYVADAFALMEKVIGLLK